MKKNTKIHLAIITLTILFTLTICGAVSAADNSTDNQTTNLSTNNSSQVLPDPYVVETGKSFTTIQAAIDDSATLNGYHIIIQTGTYTEHITVSKSLTLTGNSSDPSATIIDGTNNGRVFTISPGITVILENMTIRNGHATDGTTGSDGQNGGAIYNQGTLTLNNVVITNNQAGNGGNGAAGTSGSRNGKNGGNGGNGGAIYNTGTLTLNSCSLSGNRAANGGNGGNAYQFIVYLGNGGNGGNAGSGGAIYNTGALTLNSCTLSGNNAGNGGSGGNGLSSGANGANGNGGAICNNANLNMNNAQIYSNQANNHGSGIYTTGAGTVTIANGIIRNNANGDGIGIYVDSGSPTITGNQIYSNGNAGVYINGGSSSISGNTIRNNNQQGIYVNGGNPTINGNQIYSNTQQGIYVNSGNSNIIGNQIYSNGNAGIYINGGSSSISGNNITTNGQQGIYINNGNPVITGNNIRNNANDGIHVENYSGDSTHPIQIHYNSIVNNGMYGLHVGYIIGGIDVNATYNWWGTNSPSYFRSLMSTPPPGTNIREDYPSTSSGHVTYDPYLYLRITANPSTIYNGQTSTVTADLTRDNHNNVAPGTVPNGTPVNFSFQGAPLGTLDTNPAYTNNGQATTVFTANTVGTSHVMATVDSQTVGPANIVINPCGHVTITKTADTTNPNYHDLVTFTITATNAGPNDVTGLQITDLLPAGLTLVSADTHGFGTYTQGTGIWNINALNNGGIATLTLVANVTATGSITNWANVTAQTTHDILSFASASRALNVPAAADLAISKTVDNVSHPGQTINYQDNIRYTLTVNNSGPDAAQNVVIKDTISNLLNFNPASVTSNVAFTYNWDSVNRIFTAYLTNPLDAGAAAYLYLPAQVLAHNQQVDNTANVTTTTYDPTTPDEASTSFFVPSAADIAVTKTVNNSTPNVLDTIIYTLTVRNNGPDQATNVLVNDVLLAGLTYNHYTVTGSSGSAGIISWDPNTRTFTINGFYFDPNGYVTVDIYAIVSTILGGQHVDNTANLASLDQYDWNTTNNATTVGIDVNPAADVGVIKDVNKSSPNIGEQLDYTIMAFNNGPNGASNVTVTDTIPTGLTYVGNDHPGSTTWDPVNRVLTWFVGYLGAGNFNLLHIFATVDASPVNPTITNTASITADQYDWNLTNNQDSETIYEPVADITLSKEFENSSRDVINTAHYLDNVWTVIKAHNNGPSAATNVRIQDILPAGLTPNYSNILISTDGGNTWNPTSDYSGNIWTIANLPSGAEYWLAIGTQVTQTGDKTNNAAVTQLDQYDPTPATASATLNVPAAAYIDIYKEFRDSPWGNVITAANYHDTIWAMVEATNTGPNVTYATIKDILTGLNWTGNYRVYYAGNPNDPNNWILNDITNPFDGNNWNVFLGSLGGNTKWLAIEVTVNQTGTVSNYAETTSQSTDPYNGYDSYNATLNVPHKADLSLNKDFRATLNGSAITTANYGDHIYGILKVTNNGPDNATNINIHDVYSGYDYQGGYWVSYNGFNWIYQDTTSLFNGEDWTIPLLGNGQSIWLAIAGPVEKTGENAVTNTANETAQDQQHSGDWPGASVSLNVPPAAYLTVDKEFRATYNGSAITTAHYGDWIWTVLQAWNNGPDDVWAIIKDTPHAGLNLSNSGWYYSIDGGTTWNLGDGLYSIYNSSTHEWKVWIPGLSESSAWCYLAIPTQVTQTGNLTNEVEQTWQDVYAPEPFDHNTVNLSVPRQADVYVLTTVNKTNPTVGENIVITIKVGNNGPDAAQGVIVSYTVPSGFEFVGAAKDAGTYTYDPVTRTITWNLGDVPVGDPYMYVTLKAVSSGAFDNTARITGETTYDPNTDNKASSIVINVLKPSVPKAHAATIPLQHTGLPLAGLVLAILAVFSGLVMPKRKN